MQAGGLGRGAIAEYKPLKSAIPEFANTGTAIAHEMEFELTFS
ncbi:MAG: hypothetical protein AAF827_02735 [Cyanobacteria bacterium P01_D01_bin.6]